MDIGNPWDSAPAATPAAVEEKEAVVVPEPVAEVAWAEFIDSEMTEHTVAVIPVIF